MRTLRLLALAVKHQGVFLDAETTGLGDGILPRLDLLVEELFHVATVHADDMIVVSPLVELKHRHAVLEVAAADEACSLELRQDTVDGSQPDVLMGVNQAPVNLLGGQVLGPRSLEDFHDLQSWQRHLQSGFAQILALHASPPPIAHPRAVTVSCQP